LKGDAKRIKKLSQLFEIKIYSEGGMTMRIIFYTGKRIISTVAAVIVFVLVIAPYFSQGVQARSAKEIDVSVDVALDRFKNEVPGAKEFLNNAKGVLVIPNVIRIGFGFGGEYGEGALLIGGKNVDYYSVAAGSFGFQFGAQSKNIVIIFMDEGALTSFRDSLGWRAGVDGSVAIVDYGAGGSVDTENIQAPIVGFVFGLKGLMVNLSLEGSKFTKLTR
jgi:lipid-binding SYLF domain-containing protein